MKSIVFALVLTVVAAASAAAQPPAAENEIRRLVPYPDLLRAAPGLTLQQYDTIVRLLAAERAARAIQPLSMQPPVPDSGSGVRYLGRLSQNPYLPDSTVNPYGPYGSRYSPDSIRNPYGRYGSPYSPSGVTNPYSTSTPLLFGQDGRYLGRLSVNPYDPESVANPFGRYGSRYSPDSINNPYGRYGSPYSPLSATNPYATMPPLIVGRDRQ